MTRPEINVRKTRPSDGLLYERNEYIAYWIEEGDLENFSDEPADSINGVCGNTEEEAIANANQHWDIREANIRENLKKLNRNQ
jgi:hypothetical protein